jgi:hypothetical protein
MPNTTEHYLTREELEIALIKLDTKLEAHFNAIDARFNALDQRFLGIDQRFLGIDAKFNGIDDRFNRIDAKFNAQRTLLWGIALGVLAQIINAWIVHLK